MNIHDISSPCMPTKKQSLGKVLTPKRKVKETLFPSTFQRGKINKKSHLTQKKPFEKGELPLYSCFERKNDPNLSPVPKTSFIHSIYFYYSPLYPLKSTYPRITLWRRKKMKYPTLLLSLSLKFSAITLSPPTFKEEKTYTYTYILILSTPITTQKEFPQCLYRTKPTKILGKIASTLQ